MADEILPSSIPRLFHKAWKWRAPNQDWFTVTESPGVLGFRGSQSVSKKDRRKVTDHFFFVSLELCFSLRGTIFFPVFFWKSHKPSWLVGIFSLRGKRYRIHGPANNSHQDKTTPSSHQAVVRDKQVANKQPSRNPLMSPLFLVGE